MRSTQRQSETFIRNDAAMAYAVRVMFDATEEGKEVFLGWRRNDLANGTVEGYDSRRTRIGFNNLMLSGMIAVARGDSLSFRIDNNGAAALTNLTLSVNAWEVL